MRGELIGNMKKFPLGSATIELMIALAILATMLATAAAVSYGNFAMTQDSDSYQEGLYQVSGSLEYARAELTKDIDFSLSPQTCSTPPDGISYCVNTISDCAKVITATNKWQAGSREQKIIQSTKVVSPAAILSMGGNCTLTPPSGGWQCPEPGAELRISPNINPTALDIINIPGGASKTMAYLTSEDNNQIVFSAVDITSGDSGSYTEADADFTIVAPKGFFDVAAAWKSDGSTGYAFVAAEDSSLPLQVIDLKLGSATYGTVAATYPVAGAQAGRSIFYLNNRVYLGTLNNAGGPEFYVFDVSNPLTPSLPIASFEVGGTVNDITITNDGYAYLATGNASREMMAVNLNTSASASVDLPETMTGHKDRLGQSIFKLGERVYIGLLDEGKPDDDFYIYDISNRAAVLAPTQVAGSGFSADGNVVGIVVNGPLAFLNTTDTNDEFKVLVGLTQGSPSGVPSGTDDPLLYADKQLSNVGHGIDFENNRAYSIASNGSTVLQIYKPGTCGSYP
jgi:hypothetical protein